MAKDILKTSHYVLTLLKTTLIHLERLQNSLVLKQPQLRQDILALFSSVKADVARRVTGARVAHDQAPFGNEATK
ncbi:hypothetical protein KA529_02325 [Candidatus Saccharibacteria bacterium]|nr:hypothetical protein [Candidatus Saccharibacteria bacterium]